MMKKMSRREMLEISAGLSAAALSASSPVLGNTHASNRPSRIVSIEARPEALSFDVAKSAMIVVDMQNDFGGVGGMFHRAGVDISGIQAVVPATARAINAARAAGIKIIYLKMAFKPDLSDAGAADSVNFVRHRKYMNVGTSVKAPDGSDSRILIRDTWNTEILPELKPQPDDIVLYKHRFSGFYQTDLDVILKKLNAKHLLLTGCTTSICVESTVRDAMFRDYLPIVLTDCTAEPIGADRPTSNRDATFLNIERLFGWVSNSADLIKSLARSSA